MKTLFPPAPKRLLVAAWWFVLAFALASLPLAYLVTEKPFFIHYLLPNILILSGLLCGPLMCFLCAGLVRLSPVLARVGMTVVGAATILLLIVGIWMGRQSG